MAPDGTRSTERRIDDNQIEFAPMPFAHFSLRPFSVKPLVHAILALASAAVSSQSIADEFKVAFIGDQGVSAAARGVLELIRDEGTDLLLIQGDLGYEDNAADTWIENINSILGDDFPVLLVVGNHENFEWPAYLQWQKDRLARTPEVRCEGDIGVKSYCTYKDLGVVLVSPNIIEVEGINGDDNYEQYITDSFNTDDSTWRICSWHKNMRDMQVGGKGDATGWGVYQSCLAQGAIVVNGHEHSYSRTHLMSDFENLQVIHTNSNMNIGPDSSIAIVSGLGGREVRPQLHGGDWFASVYTETQGANHASLFCDFNGGQANCYLKDVAGLVPDQFTLDSVRDRSGVVEDSEVFNDAAEGVDQFDAEALSEADAPALGEADAPTVAEADAPTVAEAEAPTVAEADAPPVAEVDAQVAAETEAQAVAEIEAPPVAEVEAPPVAEAEAPATAEAEVQAQAEAETPIEADAEADDAGLEDDQQSDPIAIIVTDTGSGSVDLDDLPTSNLDELPTSNIDGENAPVVNAEPLAIQLADDNSATDDSNNGVSSIESAGSSGGGSLGWLSLAGLALWRYSRRPTAN